MIKVRVLDTRVGIRNCFARMPFRFGVVTMRACPQATLQIEIEDERGRRARGYAADFLAYKWFDKRPDKSLADNVADLLKTLADARELYQSRAADGPAAPFALWCELYPEIERRALAAGFNRLGASFGASMLERAVIDATGRLLGETFFELVRDNTLGIDMGRVFPELAGLSPREVLPAAPLPRVHLRHTVGLVDPIRTADITAGEAVADGLPESLEQYLAVDGLRYLKIKVGGDLDADLARLEAISEVMFAAGDDYGISLDGNEQYRDLGGFMALIEALRRSSRLRRFYDAVLFIEQPLSREVAMDAGVKPALAALTDKAVIIDEADGWVSAFHQAIELGYRGVSHKNCKGIYKSIMNLALARARNAKLGEQRYFLSAEDLSVAPVTALQADLAAVALLGIEHVERNGHHYFRGLDHLSEAERCAALVRHPDLYTMHEGLAALRIDGGQLHIGSVQTPGMGFSVLPDMAALTPAEQWSFDSLGIES